MAVTFKTFISYGWSSPAHEAWVLALAERLREDGIDAMIDKWDLQPGHDAIAFMEGMVTDPSVEKVILVCDQNYSKKADDKRGGVGTESQIISPELYGKRSQDKFSAVVTENDEEGNPYIPTFYKGRIYFDFTDVTKEEAEYERLLRWILNKPLYVKPPLGNIPGHIVTGKAPSGAQSKFRRADNLVRTGASNATGAIRDFSESYAQSLRDFDLPKLEDEDLDDYFLRKIGEIRPLIEQAKELFRTISRHDKDGSLTRDASKLINDLLPLMGPSPEATSWSSSAFDAERFANRELFLSLLAITLSEDRLDLTDIVLNYPYYFSNRSGSPMIGYTALEQSVDAFDRLNRKGNQRRLSLRADTMKKFTDESKFVKFIEIQQADLLCFLRHISSVNKGYEYWWPDTLVYTDYIRSFEIFHKAESRQYCDKLLSVLHTQLEPLKESIVLSESKGGIGFGGFSRVSINQLANVERLATRS